MVWITGDTHGDWSRLTDRKDLAESDTVIVCGDFGLWHDDGRERTRLDRLAAMPFTTVWVDGNHENFDRLKSGEFETVDFHGAAAHRIRENIFHIKRGEIMTLEGKTFWCFGGARSHDISDGVLDPRRYDKEEFRELVEAMTYNRAMFRILGQSWWPEEMPSKGEMAHGRETLAKVGYKVDFAVTHCAPYTAQVALGFRSPDDLTLYFDFVASFSEIGRWYFGHYHTDECMYDRYRPIYTKMERIV